MKEHIENLISQWSDDAEFYMTQQQKSDLATRIDKAIGIDWEKVEDIMLKNADEKGLIWFGDTAQEIAKERPLKVTVGE